MDYTFAQPVRGGYYYIVARADSKEEAVTKAEDAMKDIEHKQWLTESPLGGAPPEGLVHFGTHSEGTVVLKPDMEKRLKEFGVAHTFYRRELPPFSERMGYRSRLP